MLACFQNGFSPSNNGPLELHRSGEEMKDAQKKRTKESHPFTQVRKSIFVEFFFVFFYYLSAHPQLCENCWSLITQYAILLKRMQGLHAMPQQNGGGFLKCVFCLFFVDSAHIHNSVKTKMFLKTGKKILHDILCYISV